MNGIFLLAGSNIGDRLKHLRDAGALLIKKEITIIDESSIYETAPWGKEDQNWFLNMVLQIETSLAPDKLLQKICYVEAELGRIRKEKWGSRIIDIDILYYHDQIIKSEHLIIPHPGIADRKFTLVPLVEMRPLELHPISKKTQTDLLAECADSLDCILTDYML
ncbi:MAG: 2-amino-4-hydroxy-6-hydroxymethyldihydropteridine diphosphokinase [Ekhidna sp.]|nr:2-amino-4-hydroxy-6-hydroxymethyldihydropteridine diphosphokinase [Ekhidna sp.]MBC6425782.1 2-amino-4-hydroxy-6-hydroxymethyldihydropteridine diphosphokinase [Ekhidna sp.]